MIADLVVDLVGSILGDVVGGVLDATGRALEGRAPRLRTPSGLRALDAHTQQVWADALVAAAHVDDAHVDAREREFVERGIAAFGHGDAGRRALIAAASARATREDPLRIIESALVEMDDASRPALTRGVVAVVIAGTSSPERQDAVLLRVRAAAELDDGAWSAVLAEARVRSNAMARNRAASKERHAARFRPEKKP